MDKKSVVILGAGFGGLRAAMDTAKGLKQCKFLDKYDVTLVDRTDCHVFIPLLYRVAASADDNYEAKCTYDIASLVKGMPIKFIQAEIASMDLTKGDIALKTANGGPNVDQTIHADYLVIALGSETNFFGIPGMQEHALQIKTPESAIRIRQAVAAAFAKSGEVKIVAGGAGPNGIELAAEIRGWADRVQKKDPNLKVSISIVEALPGMLNGLDAGVAKIAANRLKKLGISVMLNAKITNVSANEISIDDGKGNASKVPFDVFIWTGGLRTPDMLTKLPIAKDQRGKPMAEGGMACVAGTPDLQLAPMIYAVGDNVCFMNPKTGKPVPAVAHVAILEGQIAARNLIEEIKHAELHSHPPATENFKPANYPYVIPIGEDWAVAKIGPFIIAGWLGAFFERLVALNYLRMIMPISRTWEAWQKI